MLSKSLLQQIANLSGRTLEQVEADIKSETEVSFELAALSKAQVDELIKQESAKAADKSYKEGKQAGIEMKLKDAKVKRGVEVQGDDFDKFLDAFSAKIIKDAGLEPSKIEEKYTGQIADLQKQLQAQAEANESTVQKYESTIKSREIDLLLTELIPRESKGLTQKQLKTLLMADAKFDIVDGSIVPVGKDNKPLTDQLYKPITAESFVKGWLTENKLTNQQSSTNHAQGKPQFTGITKLSELEKFAKDNGKIPEMGILLSEIRKSNPDFDMNN